MNEQISRVINIAKTMGTVNVPGEDAAAVRGADAVAAAQVAVNGDDANNAAEGPREESQENSENSE